MTRTKDAPRKAVCPCGEPIVKPPRGPARQWCSEECRRIYNPCSVEACDQAASSQGMCTRHYQEDKRRRRTDEQIARERERDRKRNQGGPPPHKTELCSRCGKHCWKNKSQKKPRSTHRVRSDNASGVSWHCTRKTWRVGIFDPTTGKRIEGGYFRQLEDAETAAIALRNRLDELISTQDQPQLDRLCQECKRLRHIEMGHVWEGGGWKESGKCVACGEDFCRRIRTDTIGNYCTRECQYNDWQRRARELHGTRECECEYCGTNFYPKDRNHKKARFCTKECYRWSIRKHVTHLVWRQCPCRKWMCRPGQKKHCSRKCANKYRTRARRIVKRNVVLIDELVFERDRWKCMVPQCLYPGRKCTPPDGTRDPMSASLDHVIPLSWFDDALEGHTYENSQCSHLQCNIVKNNRGGGEQLALFSGIDQSITIQRVRTKRNRNKQRGGCKNDGCPRPHFAKGFCKSCYHKDYGVNHRNRAKIGAD